MTTTNHRLRLHLVYRAAATTLVMCIAASAFVAAPSHAADPVLPPTPKPSKPARPQHLTVKPLRNTVAEAVAAGLVDQAVVDAIARSGSVDAIVTVSEIDVIETAKSSVPAGAANRDQKLITAMSKGFATRKAAVISRRAADAIVLTNFEHLPLMHVTIASHGALLKLVNDPDVTGVRVNATLQSTAMDAESPTLVRQPQAVAAGHAGAGTVVAVLDTGLNHTLSDFGSCTAPGLPASCRVIGNYEVATNDGALDNDGHGTNVAGIVAGTAPGARLIGMDVFNTTTLGQRTTDALVAQALSYLIGWKQQGVNIVAANLSLGSGTFAAACSDAYGLGAARAAGILPVVAAGNNGSNLGVGAPACSPAALSVGAVFDANVTGSFSWSTSPTATCSVTNPRVDQVTCFSQSGPTLDMLAPGAWITAAGYTMTGTSQAAPHVAGAVAILASARPAAGVSAWESALVNNGPSIVDRDGRARRRLDVTSALNSILGTTMDRTPPVVVAPVSSVVLNTVANATGVSVGVRWSATDAGGINAYAFYASTNGGAWVLQTLATPTTAQVTYVLTPGSRYQFAVAAQDRAGNWSNAVIAPVTNVTIAAESATGVVYTTGWAAVAWTSALGGSMNSTATRNASVTVTFTGRSIGWVTSRATNRGQADVYLDGVLQGRWDLYAAATQARVIALTANFATSAQHTLRIVAVGTTGRPTIDVDSFVVLN